MQNNKMTPSYTRNIIHGNAKSRTGVIYCTYISKIHFRVVKVIDITYVGQMFSARIGKRQNYKQQQRKKIPLDLKNIRKIIEAGYEKEKSPDTVIPGASSKRLTQTEFKFTIPNISTNMNLIEEVVIIAPILWMILKC